MSLLHSTAQQSKQILSTILFSVLVCTTGLFSFLIYPVLQNSISTPKIFFMYGAVLFGFFLWLLQMVSSKAVRVRRTSLDIPILISIGVFVLSSIFSLIPAISMLGKMNVFVIHTSMYITCIVWMWLLVQAIHSMKRWHILLQTLLLVGSMQGAMYLVHTIFPFSFLNSFGIISFISASSSQVSIFFAVIAVLGLGQLLVKHTTLRTKLFPFISTCISIAALFRIGFDAGFLILAIGTALLISIGISYLSEVYNAVVVAIFTTFIVSVLVLLFQSPTFLQANLPVEINMGVSSSWDIVQSSLLKNSKQFMIGTGPGTFLQSFSEYRNPAFNLNQFAWSVRFNSPYNTLFAILSEVGVFGIISFFIIIIGAMSAVLSAWKKIRPIALHGQQASTSADMARIQVFTVVAAWMALTAGLAFSYFGVSLWVLWWTLLGLVITGIATCVPQIITERRYSLEVSPQYSLLLSFVLVIVATGIVIVGAFGGRVFFADIAYTKALRSTTIEETFTHLTTTLRYREQYVPYQLSRARLALQQARIEAQQPEPNADIIANYLAIAVNTARQATAKREHDVVSWETLASMYLNTQALVPDANKWAQESLERAIALEPTNPIFYWQMGNAKAFAGELEAAEEQYKQAIRLKPDYVVAYVSLSALLESQERYDQAIAVYQPIFRLVEQNPEALFTLGRLFYNRQSEDDLQRAETVLVQAIAQSPNYANARFILGLVYEARGNRQAAIEQYTVVAEQNPDNADIRAKLESLRAPVIQPVEPVLEDIVE
jgi:tetratricopeptide (TPR) repeat protein